jgi:hypothetical protein
MEDRELVPGPGPVPGPEPEAEVEAEPEPAPARKRQRKPKKEVPVGRNGLKKRRVAKSRTTTDDKGYLGASSVFLSSCSLFCAKLPERNTDTRPRWGAAPRSDRGLFVVRIRGRGGAAS